MLTGEYFEPGRLDRLLPCDSAEARLPSRLVSPLTGIEELRSFDGLSGDEVETERRDRKGGGGVVEADPLMWAAKKPFDMRFALSLTAEFDNEGMRREGGGAVDSTRRAESGVKPDGGELFDDEVRGRIEKCIFSTTKSRGGIKSSRAGKSQTLQNSARISEEGMEVC